MRWMVLSTCILYLAILLVLISSSSENCTWSPRKGGMFNKKPGGKSSPISKPLSAIRKSPCSSNFKIPQSFVNCLSDVLPAYTVQKQKLNHLLEKSPLGCTIVTKTSIKLKVTVITLNGCMKKLHDWTFWFNMAISPCCFSFGFFQYFAQVVRSYHLGTLVCLFGEF